MPVFNTELPIAVGCDYAGFEYKTKLVPWLNQLGFQVNDCEKLLFSRFGLTTPIFAHPCIILCRKRCLPHLAFCFVEVAMVFV